MNQKYLKYNTANSKVMKKVQIYLGMLFSKQRIVQQIEYILNHERRGPNF